MKSTQTDMVSMEPQRNDDEDEDELVVEVVSTNLPSSTTEANKVGNLCCPTVSLSVFCRIRSCPTLCVWRCL